DGEPMLGGYGRGATPGGPAGAGRARRRRRPGGMPAPLGGSLAGRATSNGAHRAGPAVAPPPAQAGWPAGHPPAAPVPARATLAKPPVRRLARDLGVDLHTLTGTGPAGSISRADVEAAAGILVPGAPGAAPATEPGPPPPAAAPAAAPNGAPAGTPVAAAAATAQAGQIPTEAVFDERAQAWRLRVSGVRRATARAMVSSAFTAPHVTEFLAADLTETMTARDRLAALPEYAGVKVTPLLFVARALLVAIRRRPMINAAWVENGAGDPEIVVPAAVNLGVAVASPRGLLVPNIPDAGRLDMAGLARALHDLTARARAGQAAPADLTGGTITITNVGVFGVDIGTPILNPGEAAILAVGAIRPAPWVHEGQLAVRTVGQLALSFDHRLVDGELGSAVLADVAAMLTDPTRLLAWS
ncbi:2-oxo acid dehydrogenase subunit E2, partial [Frankia sp. CN4]